MTWIKNSLLFLFVSLWSFSFASTKQEILHNSIEQTASAYQSGAYDDMIEPLYLSFELDTILPNELSFYYGALMYHYNNKKQSTQSLVKYLKLTLKEGAYYEEALKMLALLHPGQDKRDYLPREILDRQVLPENIGEEKDVPLGVESIPCDGGEFAVCPICLGEGVKISVGSFGRVYRTCPRCQGKGVVKCDDGNHEHE